LPSRLLLSFGNGAQDTFRLAAFSPAPTKVPLRTGGMVTIRPPWTASAAVGVGPAGDRIVIVRWSVSSRVQRTTFQVEARTSAGSKVFSKMLPYQAQPLTDEIRKRWIAGAVAAGLGKAFASEEEANHTILATLDGPGLLPPVQKVLPSATGDTWLRREDAPDGRQVWQVLNKVGIARASFVAPQGLSAFLATGDELWSTLDDADGLPVVVRYRIVRK
jgi:hypothetical protein